MGRIAAAWHAAAVDEVVESVDGDPVHGRSSAAAAARLRVDGPNALPVAALAGGVAGRAASQRRLDTGAALVSAALGEAIDAVAILAIVVVDAVIGVLQESRAERAVAALARMTAPRARGRAVARLRGLACRRSGADR
jgi:Ca2+-transporting ATPase